MGKSKILAIIPARSGSKGIKDKNIRLLNGRPLLAYSIEAANKSRIFDEIYVSTDSEEYAAIAREYGASTPFLRDSKTAGDSSSTWDVVKEVIKNYEQSNKKFDIIALLQPTSPLRTEQDIINAYNLFTSTKANAVVSVCETEHSPLLCNTLSEDHSLCDFMDKKISNLPRQALDKFYRINGAIYLFGVEYFCNSRSIYDSKCIAYIMDKSHSVDIDDYYDFLFAETIMCSSSSSNI